MFIQSGASPKSLATVAIARTSSGGKRHRRFEFPFAFIAHIQLRDDVDVSGRAAQHTKHVQTGAANNDERDGPSVYREELSDSKQRSFHCRVIGEQGAPEKRERKPREQPVR